MPEVINLRDLINEINRYRQALGWPQRILKTGDTGWELQGELNMIRQNWQMQRGTELQPGGTPWTWIGRQFPWAKPPSAPAPTPYYEETPKKREELLYDPSKPPYPQPEGAPWKWEWRTTDPTTWQPIKGKWFQIKIEPEKAEEKSIYEGLPPELRELVDAGLTPQEAMDWLGRTAPVEAGISKTEQARLALEEQRLALEEKQYADELARLAREYQSALEDKEYDRAIRLRDEYEARKREIEDKRRWEKEFGATEKWRAQQLTESERARGLEQQLWQAQELVRLAGPADWIQRWMLLNPAPAPEAGATEEQLARAGGLVRQQERALAFAKTPFERVGGQILPPTQLNPAEVAARQALWSARGGESALQALGSPTQAGTPPAPPWLSQFVPSQVAGQPITQAPIRTPSGQQWAATPWSVQQGLAGYADFAGYRPIEDILAHMYQMQPATPRGAGYQTWQPVRQWG